MTLARLAGLLITTLPICFGASPSAHRDYRLKLAPLVAPPAGDVGVLIRARINGGPTLRLLLDSGAQYVTLDRRAAAKSGCSGGEDLDLVGAGAPAAATARKLTAATVEIADLTLRDVPLLVTSHGLGDGIDGVAPLCLFSEYLIRLDLPSKTLDLLEYPDGPSDTNGAVRAVASNDLLFLKGAFNEAREGYFLLDTGAAYNAISPNLDRQLIKLEAGTSSVGVRGGTAAWDVSLFPDRARLRIGPRELAAERVVVIDLSTASRYHGLEVSGLIGYPALRNSVVSVNYRDGLVRIDPR